MEETFPAHIPVIEHAKLKNYTTFQLGGACRSLFECAKPEDLIETVSYLAEAGLPFILIGGGSNIVVSDKGVDCHVVRYFSKEPLINREGHKITVSGSTRLDDLVQYAAAQGLAGINYASGIPGTVGGAVLGNAGAFGKQIGDVLLEATLLTKDGLLKTVRQQDLGFSYRHSNLKESDDIILSVKIFLQEGDKDALQKERLEILKTREEKHPDLKTQPCAGSFFRNIEPTSAAGKRQATGFFLEQAGGKALSHGGAKIFEKHANIIIKGKDANAQDVFELQKKMAQLAKEKCQLDLVREVRFVGDFAGKPEDVTSVIW